MPKRISKKRRDPNQTVAAVVALVSEDELFLPDQALLSQIMSLMGRKGGRIGGKRRLEMSPKKRSQLARKAAKARWSKPATKLG